MKRFIIVFLFIIFVQVSVQANESVLIKQNSIQTRINKTASKIMNANKLDKRVIFVYDSEAKEGLIKGTKALTKRQIVIYGETYKHIETDDELAAYIAREIPAAIRS